MYKSQRASGRIPRLGMVVNMVFLLRRLVGMVVEGFWAGVDMGVGMDVGMGMAVDQITVAVCLVCMGSSLTNRKNLCTAVRCLF